MESHSNKIVYRRVTDLSPYKGNARTHSKRQIRQIADSIKRFGFNNPVLIADDGEVIAGHGRLAAAKLLGMENVPTVELAHLTKEERRAYVLADNKLAANAGWDNELLAIELKALADLDFDVSLTGFSVGELDVIFDDHQVSADTGSAHPEDEIIGPGQVAVSRPGDVWDLGRHRLICGDARDAKAYEQLLAGQVADVMFTDPRRLLATSVGLGASATAILLWRRARCRALSSPFS